MLRNLIKIILFVGLLGFILSKDKNIDTIMGEYTNISGEVGIYKMKILLISKGKDENYIIEFKGERDLIYNDAHWDGTMIKWSDKGWSATIEFQKNKAVVKAFGKAVFIKK